MFVAFSCKQRCTCPLFHQKRTLLTSLNVAEKVCTLVAHRQVVLTIPKRPIDLPFQQCIAPARQDILEKRVRELGAISRVDL
jgi:hypothetical protein